MVRYSPISPSMCKGIAVGSAPSRHCLVTYRYALFRRGELKNFRDPESKSAIGQQKNKPFGDGGAHDSENNLIADAPGQERR
jgi:hypothetical protein